MGCPQVLEGKYLEALMRERFEWVEPIEVARELRERSDREFRAGHIFLGWGIPLCVPAALAVLLLSEDPVQAIPTALCILAVSLYPLGVRLMMHRESAPLERTCSLGVRDKLLWKHARSFEFADHPTLPDIRCLTLHMKDARPMARFSFREGQLDEAELRAFVQSRIAEPTTQRLMRRVKM